MKELVSKGFIFGYSLYLILVGFVSIFLPRWGANYLQLQYVDTVMTRSYGICFLLLGAISFVSAMDMRRYFLNFIIVSIGAILFLLQYLYEWLMGTAGLLQLGIPFLATASYLYCTYKMLTAGRLLR